MPYHVTCIGDSAGCGSFAKDCNAVMGSDHGHQLDTLLPSCAALVVSAACLALAAVHFPVWQKNNVDWWHRACMVCNQPVRALCRLLFLYYRVCCNISSLCVGCYFFLQLCVSTAGSYFALSLFDRMWHQDLTEDEAIAMMEVRAHFWGRGRGGGVEGDGGREVTVGTVTVTVGCLAPGPHTG
jgi:hypothetical protein